MVSQIQPANKPAWLSYDPYKPQVLKSQAGYYIGTVDKEGMPYARWSDCYFYTEEEAQEALKNGSYPMRPHP